MTRVLMWRVHENWQDDLSATSERSEPRRGDLSFANLLPLGRVSWMLFATVIGVATIAACSEQPAPPPGLAKQPPKHVPLVRKAMQEGTDELSRSGSAFQRVIALGNDAVPALEYVIAEDLDELQAAFALCRIGTAEAFNAAIRGARRLPHGEADYYMRLLSRIASMNPEWHRRLLSEDNAKWVDWYVTRCDEERAVRLIEQLGPARYRGRLRRLLESDNAELRLKAEQLLAKADGEREEEAAREEVCPAEETLRITHEALPTAGDMASSASLLIDSAGSVLIALVRRSDEDSSVQLLDAVSGAERSTWEVEGLIRGVSFPNERYLLAVVRATGLRTTSVQAWDTSETVVWSSVAVENAVAAAALVANAKIAEVIVKTEADRLVVLGPKGAQRDTAKESLLLRVIPDPVNRRYLLYTHTALRWWSVEGDAEASLDRNSSQAQVVDALALLSREKTRVVIGGKTDESTSFVAAYDDGFHEVWKRNVPYPVEALAACASSDNLPDVLALTVDGTLRAVDAAGEVMAEFDTGWTNAMGRLPRGLSCALSHGVLYVLVHDRLEHESRVYTISAQ